jgi:hypothetical protein
MYRVSYYMGNSRTRKYFSNLSDAIKFSVYRIPFESLFEIAKEEV